MNWFGTEESLSHEQNTKVFDTEFLRDLMIEHPNEQYVYHDGEWIYLDPIMRKDLLDLPEDEESKVGKQYSLDIRDNENELEYQLPDEGTPEFKNYPFLKT
ncbi:hypothetical protein LIZ76_16960 [Caldibacillus sp. 210928-DFI.2.22]|uniref:hypothetical protein n=1 Tax=Bacillaceae TaxID=186817 RepID=UPI001D08468B|nr:MULTISPECIES: hypothetical protein [unclassified Caldibacillus]MCB7071599.1 hypothetical protein [Caldibacillus sp. 210928-DFI.2.22]MCB7075033.1 hypothetical protein [Caldibacillus sp. 210928-DFI.2.18]